MTRGMQTTDMEIARHRLIMALLGGAMGLTLWLLGRQWDNPALPPALFLALISWAAAYAAVALALAGPVAVSRALAGAAVPATVVAALISLAGLRHMRATDVLDDPAMLGAVAVFLLFSLPFTMLWLRDRAAVLRYAALFDAAWNMLVRYTAAWLFLAIFTLLAFLGDALLDLVGIDVIGRVFDEGWTLSAVGGAVLGLGLAVIYEARETISPGLVLRLLRLLLVPVLAVVAVFLGALPFRGLTQLFGAFSAAGVLSGTAIVGITLISTALDRSDREAVRARGLRLATRLFALLLPVLAGLAVWAVALRVRDYGWTPDRLMAAAVGLVLLAYGLAYGLAALRGGEWMARIRQANVALALCVIAVSGLWMTPVLNVYRLSTDSQLARFQAGRSSVEQLPLWQMAHDWGRAGQAGLARLAAMPERPELLARIEDVRNQVNPYQYEQAVQRRIAPERVRALLRLLPLRPAGSDLPAGFLTMAPSYRLDRWLAGCRRLLPDGRAGCVLVQGAFSPAATARDQGILLYLDGEAGARADHLILHADGELTVREVFDPVNRRWPTLPAAAVAQALDGAYRIAPSGDRALFLGGEVLAPGR